MQVVSIYLNSCEAFENEKELSSSITRLIRWNNSYLVSAFHCFQVVSLKQIHVVSYNWEVCVQKWKAFFTPSWMTTVTCSSGCLSEHGKRKYPLWQREAFCHCQIVRVLSTQKSTFESSGNTEHDTEQKVSLLTFFFILLSGLKIFQIFQMFSER